MRREGLPHRGGGLAGPQEQDAVAVEREVEQRQHLLLHRRLQVDQQIAAGDQIDARERRVANHVVLGVHDHLPQIRHDLVHVADLAEVAPDAILRKVRQRRLVVHGVRRPFQRAAVNVGREDLHGARPARLHQIVKDDGQRIGLLAGRAPGDPHAQRRLGRRSIEQLRAAPSSPAARRRPDRGRSRSRRSAGRGTADPARRDRGAGGGRTPRCRSSGPAPGGARSGA